MILKTLSVQVRMISSFTYELRRGEKGDIPGLRKRRSRTRWLQESSGFPYTDAALCWNTAALQLHTASPVPGSLEVTEAKSGCCPDSHLL